MSDNDFANEVQATKCEAIPDRDELARGVVGCEGVSFLESSTVPLVCAADSVYATDKSYVSQTIMTPRLACIDPSSPGRPGSGKCSPLKTHVALRTAYESALLVAVRKQIASVEARFFDLLKTNLQESERLREASLSRLEAQISAKITESLAQHQPTTSQEASISRLDAKIKSSVAHSSKLDKRLAELTGSCKGVSDELQLHIRRSDAIESRVRECKLQAEEESRRMITCLEQRIVRIGKDTERLTASYEDAEEKTSQQFEQFKYMIEEQMLDVESIKASVLGLRTRFNSLEPRAEHLASTGDIDTNVEAGPTISLAIQRRMADLSEVSARWLGEMHQLRERMDSQEVRMGGFQTLFESKDVLQRALSEMIGQSDGRKKVNQLQNWRCLHEKSLDLLHHRVAEQETIHNQLCREVEGIHEYLRRDVILATEDDGIHQPALA